MALWSTKSEISSTLSWNVLIRRMDHVINRKMGVTESNVRRYHLLNNLGMEKTSCTLSRKCACIYVKPFLNKKRKRCDKYIGRGFSLCLDQPPWVSGCNRNAVKCIHYRQTALRIGCKKIEKIQGSGLSGLYVRPIRNCGVLTDEENSDESD